MSPLGKGPIWLAILAETFWLVQVSEINMHHASKKTVYIQMICKRCTLRAGGGWSMQRRREV
jgi:hypothetical protein